MDEDLDQLAEVFGEGEALDIARAVAAAVGLRPQTGSPPQSSSKKRAPESPELVGQASHVSAPVPSDPPPPGPEPLSRALGPLAIRPLRDGPPDPDTAAFEALMAESGVVAFEDLKAPERVATASAVRKKGRAEQERADFEAAMARIGPVLDKDAAPPPPPPTRASRVRTATYSSRQRLSIDLTLDLHGLTADRAARELARFVESAWMQRLRRVLVITGKGQNSPGDPVLRPLAIHWIHSQGVRFIRSVGPAPRLQGGNGALVLELRGRQP